MRDSYTRVMLRIIIIIYVCILIKHQPYSIGGIVYYYYIRGAQSKIKLRQVLIIFYKYILHIYITADMYVTNRIYTTKLTDVYIATIYTYTLHCTTYYINSSI